jgi:hypothetical protein
MKRDSLDDQQPGTLPEIRTSVLRGLTWRCKVRGLPRNVQLLLRVSPDGEAWASIDFSGDATRQPAMW